MLRIRSVLLEIEDKIVSDDILYQIKTKKNISPRLKRLESLYVKVLENKMFKSKRLALKGLSHSFS